jgi:hypothetical protein
LTERIEEIGARLLQGSTCSTFDPDDCSPPTEWFGSVVVFDRDLERAQRTIESWSEVASVGVVGIGLPTMGPVPAEFASRFRLDVGPGRTGDGVLQMAENRDAVLTAIYRIGNIELTVNLSIQP